MSPHLISSGDNFSVYRSVPVTEYTKRWVPSQTFKPYVANISQSSYLNAERKDKVRSGTTGVLE